MNCVVCLVAAPLGSGLGGLPDGALVARVHLTAEWTAVRLGKLHRVRYRTDYSARTSPSTTYTKPLRICALLEKERKLISRLDDEAG